MKLFYMFLNAIHIAACKYLFYSTKSLSGRDMSAGGGGFG